MNLLKYCLSATKKELFHFVTQELKRSGYQIIKTHDFVHGKGSLPVLINAHADTVHEDERKRVKNLFFDAERRTFWSPQGLGADDRSGVYVLLKIVKDGLRPSVLMTDGEEYGGWGASAFLDHDDCSLALEVSKNNNYIIGLDRRGDMESVFYDCANRDFFRFIKKFGFKKRRGSFADNSTLSPFLELAAANLSAGYYHEHTKSEYLDVSALERTIKAVKRMLPTKTGRFSDDTQLALVNKKRKSDGCAFYVVDGNKHTEKYLDDPDCHDFEPDELELMYGDDRELKHALTYLQSLLVNTRRCNQLFLSQYAGA